jgi:TetR/AcrR family transcriptional repressor of nem operon
MARRTAAEKADTHRQIVRQAARLFRAQGSGAGIAEVMDDVGLTHGGFYRHFGSKDDLLIEAITLALQEIAERLVRAAESGAPGSERASIISAYLSTAHIAHPETWCAVATLAADLGRAPLGLRKRLDAAMFQYVERIAPYMPGATKDDRQRNCIVLLSGMAGAVAMIRALGDAAARESVLTMVRDYYLQAFGDKPAN